MDLRGFIITDSYRLGSSNEQDMNAMCFESGRQQLMRQNWKRNASVGLRQNSFRSQFLASLSFILNLVGSDIQWVTLSVSCS